MAEGRGELTFSKVLVQIELKQPQKGFELDSPIPFSTPISVV